jgi:MerR family transcriptional regulator/heat shock protein HspR
MASFDDRALYIISVAAELAGVHPQTLRIYERKGLIAPARTVGRSRRYSDRDIALLRRIQELTNEGVGLAGVRRILELEARVDELRRELERARREARDAVERVHRRYRRDLVPLRQTVVPTRPR